MTGKRLKAEWMIYSSEYSPGLYAALNAEALTMSHEAGKTLPIPRITVANVVSECKSAAIIVHLRNSLASPWL
jgi:hypothetical protein